MRTEILPEWFRKLFYEGLLMVHEKCTEKVSIPAEYVLPSGLRAPFVKQRKKKGRDYIL
jgi:hypothetical protein